MHEKVHRPIATGELQRQPSANAADGTTNLAHEEYESHESPRLLPRELLLLPP
jgi:hypothetical protein